MSGSFFAMLPLGLQGFFKTYTPVIRLFGQSNARGSNNLASQLPESLQGSQPQFKIWNNSTFENYHARINSLGNDFSVEPYVMNWLNNAFDEDIYIIKYGVGGTTLGINPTVPTQQCWVPSGYQLYDNLIATTTAALGYSFSKPPALLADIWIQGESDAADGSDYYSVYETNQRALINTLRSDTTTLFENEGYDMNVFLQRYNLTQVPFIDVQLSLNTIYPLAGKEAVRAAKVAINEDVTVTDTFLVDTTDATFVDGQHYEVDSIENILSTQINSYLESLYQK